MNKERCQYQDYQNYYPENPKRITEMDEERQQYQNYYPENTKKNAETEMYKSPRSRRNTHPIQDRTQLTARGEPVKYNPMETPNSQNYHYNEQKKADAINYY